MVKTVRNLTVLGIGLGASAVVGWLLFRESKRGKEAGAALVKSQFRAPQSEEIPEIRLPLEALETVPEAEPPAPAETGDDLTRIKDIGPRFAEALHAIGITRYAQLAVITPEALAEQLAPHIRIRADRIRTNDWIGQARQFARNS